VNTVTTTQQLTEFCAKNAGNSICVKNNTGPSGVPGTGSGTGSGGGGTGAASAPASSFGGTCGAGFTCSGDAVQCAMARDQLARNCQMLNDAPANNAAVVAAAAGDQPTGHPYLTPGTKDFSGGFDQTNIMSGGCPADVSVTVSHFNAVTLPFSSLCTPATWLGNILVAITALCCVGIVFKGSM
jgi:hypothetical protein